MKESLEPGPIEPSATGEAAVPVDVDAGASERNPWKYVPSLYFMQGLPVMAVQSMSVTMYKTMGIDNARIGLWTSLIAWPWIFKMLWGPLVDNTATKRSWIIVMQALIIAALGLVALGVNQSAFFALTLALFFIVAFLSATHDIAADGFYLLALPSRLQAFFVGIRSASFRLATIFTTGTLVMIAGNLQKEGEAIPRSWMMALGIGVVVYGLLFLYGLWALPKPAADQPRAPANVAEILLRFGQIVLMMVAVFLVGRLVVLGAAATNPLFPKPVFTQSRELTPLFVQATPGQAAEVRAAWAAEIAAAKALRPEDEAVQKEASAKPTPFVSDEFAIPAPLQLALSLGLIGLAYWSTRRLFARIGMGPAAAEYFGQSRIVPILGFILFYRFGESMIAKMSSPFLLDPAEKGGLGVHTTAVGTIVGTVGVIALTLGGLIGGWVIAKHGIKRSIWPMVLALNVPNFFYLYLSFVKPRSPLSDRIVSGQLPFAHIDVPKAGLVPLDWLADFVVNIPSQIYNLFLLVFEALKDPVGQVIVVDQFGYGFGFAAYLVYLMFIAQGSRHQTSHYAISTGLMALGAMFAGIASGYVQQYFGANYGSMGYAYFFIAVIVCTIPGMLVLFFIPMDRQDLRTAPVEID